MVAVAALVADSETDADRLYLLLGEPRHVEDDLRGDDISAFTLLRGTVSSATPIGFITVLAGWTTTETGRQPFTVYGLLRTADSASAERTS